MVNAARGQTESKWKVSDVADASRALRAALINATSRSGATASRILRVATSNQGIWMAGAVAGVIETGRTSQL